MGRSRMTPNDHNAQASRCERSMSCHAADTRDRVLRCRMPTFTPIPDLPAKGARVTLEQMQRLCAAKGLPHLWQRIKADPPRKPFASDGCSLFFNQIAGVSIYPACFFHDLKYWAGYPTMDPSEQLERFVADAELMIEFASL